MKLWEILYELFFKCYLTPFNPAQKERNSNKLKEFMNSIYRIIVLFLMGLFCSCEDPSPFIPKNDPVPFEVDEYIFFDGRIGTESEEWILPDMDNISILLDVSQYPWAKRITFVPTIWTESSDNQCFVELYNLTEKKGISSSRVSTNNYLYTEVPSSDILPFLPQEPTHLTLRIRSENKGVYVASEARAFLIIHRE